MALEAVGAIVLIVDGEEIDCVSCEPDRSTGRKPVPTMNRKRITKYVTQGVKSNNLNVVVVVPIGKSIDWDNIEDARISIENPEGGFRETYIGCSTTQVGESFNAEGETRRTLSMFALDYIKESM
jgi:hypothetical protein